MFYSEQGKALTVWKVIFTSLVTLILLLRFEATRIKKRALRLDDYFLLLSYVSTTHPTYREFLAYRTIRLVCS